MWLPVWCLRTRRGLGFKSPLYDLGQIIHLLNKHPLSTYHRCELMGRWGGGSGAAVNKMGSKSLPFKPASYQDGRQNWWSLVCADISEG